MARGEVARGLRVELDEEACRLLEGARLERRGLAIVPVRDRLDPGDRGLRPFAQDAAAHERVDPERVERLGALHGGGQELAEPGAARLLPAADQPDHRNIGHALVLYPRDQLTAGGLRVDSRPGADRCGDRRWMPADLALARPLERRLGVESPPPLHELHDLDVPEVEHDAVVDLSDGRQRLGAERRERGGDLGGAVEVIGNQETFPQVGGGSGVDRSSGEGARRDLGAQAPRGEGVSAGESERDQGCREDAAAGVLHGAQYMRAPAGESRGLDNGSCILELGRIFPCSWNPRPARSVQPQIKRSRIKYLK